jgi:hypothetical protein
MLIVARMKYDHSRKAGNQGDVWKHAMLLTLADSITAETDIFHSRNSSLKEPAWRLVDFDVRGSTFQFFSNFEP